MKLPNFENAIVSSTKLEGYLLSEVHPVGRAKALFLKNLGYDDTAPHILERDLLSIAGEEDVSHVQASEYGTKYIIDGMIRTPSGATVTMRRFGSWKQITLDPDSSRPIRPESLVEGDGMIKELDTVVLTHSIKEHNLEQGDVGTVVHCYPGDSFEVEFVTGEGNTAAVLTLTGDEIRPMGKGEILHAREYTVA